MTKVRGPEPLHFSLPVKLDFPSLYDARCDQPSVSQALLYDVRNGHYSTRSVLSKIRAPQALHVSLPRKSALLSPSDPLCVHQLSVRERMKQNRQKRVQDEEGKTKVQERK